MTDDHDDKQRQLERVLTGVYRAQPDPIPGEGLTMRVMREIRRETGDGGRWIALTGIDQLVWRAATVAAAVVLVVSVCTVGVVRSVTGERAGMFAEELDSAPLLGDE